MKRTLSISAWFAILAFVPVGLALGTGFWVFSRSVEANVAQGLAETLAEAQRAQSRLRMDARRQQQLYVSALSENATFKAALELWRDSRTSPAARRTVEDLLAEIGASLDADLLAMIDPDGRVVALLERRWRRLAAVPGQEFKADARGRLIRLGERIFDSTAVPVNTETENLGTLVVGTVFDAASYHAQAVLLHDGRILSQSGLTADPALLSALAVCGSRVSECRVTLAGKPYLALAVESGLGNNYEVWTLHSVEQAAGKLLGTARLALWSSLAGLLLAAFVADFLGARVVTSPLRRLVDRLRESERSGVLTGDFPVDSSTSEVNDLAHAFNLAAQSVADSQRQLDEAYLQITETMAQTLDARDPYTAGHSSRVSDYAVALAEAMNVSAQDVDVIRIGANLHDIGKIGIPDAVLQKAGALTEAEFGVIKRHPVIGKRILEGVAKFHDYLAIVELHHENHDGSGYPWGLRGENVPLGARIVHVVDAYDAMTTNRPYRGAMAPDQAISIIRQNAGSQFDPAVVEVFLRLVQANPAMLPAVAARPGDGAIASQLWALEANLQGNREAYVEEPAS